jgi:uncharacterized protein YjbI with pentapeptide repeats
LSRLDLSEQDFQQANLEEADINGIIFEGVRGLDAVNGLDRPAHRDSAKF